MRVDDNNVSLHERTCKEKNIGKAILVIIFCAIVIALFIIKSCTQQPALS